MTYKEVKKLIDTSDGNLICKQFCILPNQIVADIKEIVHGEYEYGYIVIGVSNSGSDYSFEGIDRHINMSKILETAIKQVQIDTTISYDTCPVNGKSIYIIKVKTCARTLSGVDIDKSLMDEIMKELLSACVKLQANAIYHGASEDQRNDYIRDILETAGYDVKDQTRRGLSPSGKAAGEVDILIKNKNFPVTIIEALNLTSLNTSYLDNHIDKIYGYDTAGNAFNTILSYVTVSDFVGFYNKYIEHIKGYKYPFEIISVEENVDIGKVSYSDIKVMKTLHNRNGVETLLYHICVLLK